MISHGLQEPEQFNQQADQRLRHTLLFPGNASCMLKMEFHDLMFMLSNFYR